MNDKPESTVHDSELPEDGALTEEQVATVTGGEWDLLNVSFN